MPGETKDAQKEEDNGVNDEILPCKQIESDWESDDVHAAEPVTKCAKNKNLAPKIQKGVIAKALSILALIQTHILSGEAKIDATGSVREGYLGFTKLWVRQPNFQNAIKSLKGTAPWANTRKLTTMDGHLKMVYEAFNVFRLGVDRKADKRKAQGKLAAPEYRFSPLLIHIAVPCPALTQDMSLSGVARDATETSSRHSTGYSNLQENTHFALHLPRPKLEDEDDDDHHVAQQT
eukprot:2271066-Rhodomonas_salina.1